VIQEQAPVFAPGQDRATLLLAAALAAKWREPPRDALDRLVLSAAGAARASCFARHASPTT
jgi:H+-transporting ATPase